MQKNQQIAPFNRAEHCRRIGFQKGQSGNPEGKKLGTKNILNQLMDNALSICSFDESGHPLTKEQAMAKILVDLALKGNVKAIKYVVDLKYGKVK
jgi:hypothetical protein